MLASSTVMVSRSCALSARPIAVSQVRRFIAARPSASPCAALTQHKPLLRQQLPRPFTPSFLLLPHLSATSTALCHRHIHGTNSPSTSTTDATSAPGSTITSTAAASHTTGEPIVDEADAPPPPSWLQRSCPPALLPYFLLARADKPVGTWLLLLPCLWSVSLAAPAGSLPDLQLMGLLSVGAFVMRGAGCTINDLWDRDIDAKVARTRGRPLACGMITVPQAIGFLGVQMAAGLYVALQLNHFALGVACASLPLVVIYPLMKRLTYWPQLVLGLTFNWGALVGYAAVHGSLAPMLLPLYASGVCWTLVYDTIYAHQDVVDDRRIGVRSTALRFAEHTKPVLGGFATAMIGGLATMGHMADLGPIYQTTLAASAIHLAWQLTTVDLTQRASCNAKFVSNVKLGWIVLLGIVLDRLFAQPKAEPAQQQDSEQPARKKPQVKSAQQ